MRMIRLSVTVTDKSLPLLSSFTRKNTNINSRDENGPASFTPPPRTSKDTSPSPSAENREYCAGSLNTLAPESRWPPPHHRPSAFIFARLVASRTEINSPPPPPSLLFSLCVQRFRHPPSVR